MPPAGVGRCAIRSFQFGALDVLYHGVGWSAPGAFLELDPPLQLYELNFQKVCYSPTKRICPS